MLICQTSEVLWWTASCFTEGWCDIIQRLVKLLYCAAKRLRGTFIH